jgi:glucose-6-phosphate isomerase
LSREVPFLELRTSFDHEPLSSGVMDVFNEWEEQGKLGFMDLPGNEELLRSSIHTASVMRSRSSRMLVTGIGGSSLGLKALMDALSTDPPVTVADSPDSAFLSRLESELDPASSSMTVVTKSGGTAETMAIFLSLYRWLERTGDSADRIVAVTDPERGDLRKLAEEKGWLRLPVPPAVGGRFSVMSPVGIFPAAYAGIDVRSLLRGAAAVTSDFRDRRQESLAARTASAFLTNFEKYPVHAFFCYDDRLFSTALWFSQLWAESLGKKLDLSGREVHSGQTPLACRGPADQHSLVQLFMEGPADKTVTFVTTPSMDDAPVLPGGFDDYPSIAYLEGLTLDGLRLAEGEATARALEEKGVPVTSLSMASLDAEALGGLMMTLEIATVLCGLALGIDPLDQPGVERGKVLAYKALGRPGYQDR